MDRQTNRQTWSATIPLRPLDHGPEETWRSNQYKMLSYQYMNSHYKDNTVMRPSHHHNGNLHTWKDGLYIETGLAIILMALCKSMVSPLVNHWSYFTVLVLGRNSSNLKILFASNRFIRAIRHNILWKARKMSKILTGIKHNGRQFRIWISVPSFNIIW